MKWQLDTNNPAGRIQVGRLNKAVSNLSMQHNCFKEKWGIIGGEEHESSYYAIMGGGRRDDVAKVQTDIGDKYAWTVSKKNVNDIIADIEAALPTLKANTPIKDKRITAEAAAERDEKNRIAAEERDAKEAAKQAESDKIAAELRQKYPYAIARGSMSNQAHAAANMRAELQRTFPGIAFSVTSKSFSMGDSVDVSWKFGATSDEVDSVIKKYQSGHFDGMTDSYDDNRDAYSLAVKQVLGHSKYVHGQRSVEVEPELLEKLCVQCCELHGVAYEGQQTKLDYGQWGDDVKSVVRSILYGTSFPAGAVITGIELRGVDGGINKPEVFYRASFTVSAVTTPPTAETTGASGATVRRNAELNGVEVKFESKPDADIISRLKSAGFRWSMRSKVWYKRFSEYAWKQAEEIAGVQPEAITDKIEAGTYTTKQEEQPDAFDMAVEDRMAEQCGL